MTAASSYECPDCGAALPNEVGTQECECGFVCETFSETRPRPAMSAASGYRGDLCECGHGDFDHDPGVPNVCKEPTCSCHMFHAARSDRPASDAASTPLGPLHVRRGSNQYEWHVYEGMVRIGTLPTQREAAAFMDGYEKGVERDV